MYIVSKTVVTPIFCFHFVQGNYMYKVNMFENTILTGYFIIMHITANSLGQANLLIVTKS